MAFCLVVDPPLPNTYPRSLCFVELGRAKSDQKGKREKYLDRSSFTLLSNFVFIRIVLEKSGSTLRIYLIKIFISYFNVLSLVSLIFLISLPSPSSFSSLFPLFFLSFSSLFPLFFLSFSSLFPLFSLSVSSLFPLFFLSFSSLLIPKV
jgi:hypothetical protein